MARKLYYKVLDDGSNRIEAGQWEELSRLQKWYNAEFFWTAGKLGFKMYAIFPNFSGLLGEEEELQNRIVERRAALRMEGLTENEIILKLEEEGLLIVKRGGYFENCLASGFTRVASNEWNAFLVCDFLLKASRIIPGSVIRVEDEGEFIKPKLVHMRDGTVSLPLEPREKLPYYRAMVSNRHVFSIVDAAKYDHHPDYQSTVSNFNELDKDEQSLILHDWNWLGFERNYDVNGDDIRGYNLNRKVSSFEIASQGDSPIS